uniref:Fe2OG dioxygenase domain-containing protein n=2 Tax=Trieres chinensis TaxID=1514140 RepID=A0A7S1ZNJ8_TRICV
MARPRRFQSRPLSLPLFLLHSSLLLPLISYVRGQRYDVNDERAPVVERRREQVYRAADVCAEEVGTSLGEDFLSCVVEGLERDGKNGDGDAFPVPPHSFHPLTVHGGRDSANHGLMLLDLLRNYTCDRVEDGGSPPVRTSIWTYDERINLDAVDRMSCPAHLVDDDEDEDEIVDWVVRTGFLPAGDDTGRPGEYTIEEAEKQCEGTKACGGFTYKLGDGPKQTIWFKGLENGRLSRVNKSDKWRSHLLPRKPTIPRRCLVDVDEEQEAEEEEYAPPTEYEVEIIRDEPLVAVVPHFASDADCAALMKAGKSDEHMGRAQEFGQGATEYRRSYSSNIQVDYEDRSDPITRFSERMFAFVRDVGGYDVHGPGQEPINAVLYRRPGDEYRPHCDGPCHGGPYNRGDRVATSILYCDSSDDGGGRTSFTRSGLMVSPRRGSLLLFTYKYENGTVDTGFTEHSGCPIKGGRKWIATQWYREGVDYDRDWESYAYDR